MVRERIRQAGGQNLHTLHVKTRDTAPHSQTGRPGRDSLTVKYDLVIIDSLDSHGGGSRGEAIPVSRARRWRHSWM